MGGSATIRSPSPGLIRMDGKKGGLTHSHGRSELGCPLFCVPWASNLIFYKWIVSTSSGLPIPLPLNIKHATECVRAGNLALKNCANSVCACGLEGPTLTERAQVKPKGRPLTPRDLEVFSKVFEALSGD